MMATTIAATLGITSLVSADNEPAKRLNDAAVSQPGVDVHEFIVMNREEIIRRCRAKVATRSIPPPTEAEIDHGVPVFLDQLRNELRLGETTSPEISTSAIRHGHDLLRQGFTKPCLTLGRSCPF